MNPWDLIVWALATSASILIITPTVTLLAFCLAMVRGKI